MKLESYAIECAHESTYEQIKLHLSVNLTLQPDRAEFIIYILVGWLVGWYARYISTWLLRFHFGCCFFSTLLRKTNFMDTMLTALKLCICQYSSFSVVVIAAVLLLFCLFL